ncbi:MAG TPA: efflux RND transporter permease subunit, partial [Terriglobales bacterium]
IGDVSAVAPSVKPVYTIVTANGKPGVLLSINRQPDSNTVHVADDIHSEVEALRRELPASVKLEPFYDQSNIVNASINSVRDAILIGLVLASIVLVLFLHDWGSSIVAGLVIPVTLMVTMIVLKLMGQSFNLMTLGGLAAAVGLVIDDAIVVVENIVLHRDAGQGRSEAIRSALKEITVPLVGSTITPIVVFLPLISITGVTGTFFRALAVTMSVALLSSLALALTWTPTLSHYLVRRNAPEPERVDTLDSTEEFQRLMAAEEQSISGFFGRVIRLYERWLRRALEHPIWLTVLSILLIVVSFASYSALGSDLLPHMDEGGFILDYLTPPGTSLQETDRALHHIEQILQSTPEVESISRRTGLQLGLAAVTEANRGDFTVKLKPNRSRSSEEIIDDLRGKIREAEPVVDIEFAQLLSDMIGDLTGAPEPIVIKLFCQDPDVLKDTAPKVADAISKVNGVTDLLNGIDNTTSGPAVQFDVNAAAAARAGFTPEEVAVDASAIVEGEPAAAPVITHDRAYTVRVRFPEQDRASLEAISNTLLNSASGHTATLGSLATLKQVPGEIEINRENLQTMVEVTARLEGTDLGTGVANVKKAVAELHLPSNIRVEYGGTYQEQQKSFHDLAFVLGLALLLVFAVLLLEFRTFSAPVAILASAVLSTSGVFFALLITRTDFNIASFMGLIMVVGIVAKNGILLLDADQRFRAIGMDAEEAMIQAGRRRLRPIVMTALAAVAGMFPLALALGSGSQMLQPLAIAVIGGILISMVLSLILTPAVHYYMTGRR